MAVALPWRAMSDTRRIAGLVLIGAASVVLTAVQPDGGGYAGVYIVVVIAATRLPLGPRLAVARSRSAGTVAAGVRRDEPGAHISGLLFSVIPWFMVIRLMRRMRADRDHAEALVEELRESRAETAREAAVAERGRLARDMHDVLAHSLSALALQLEGARLLARDRGTDPEVVAAIERAHHLAGSGLNEAREAISALRGDDMPGLDSLAGGFGDASRWRSAASRASSPPRRGSRSTARPRRRSPTSRATAPPTTSSSSSPTRPRGRGWSCRTAGRRSARRRRWAAATG